VTEQTQIPATQVKELRDVTGAGMMDAKRALVETNGDLEAARQLLREQGLASAGKRAGRETTEGTVVSRIEGSRGAMVAVGCETEPVSGNEEFLGFAQHLLDAVWVEGPEAAASLEEERIELVAKLGENIVVVGAERYDAAEAEVVADYIHPPARKIGVLVRAKATPELARMLAMHIAAARPRYLTREEIPEHEVAEERAVYEKLPEVESKPEDVRPKIVEGMLAKRFFAATVLLDQQWVHDPSLTVAKALSERDAEVRAFVRYNVGAEAE
jgi:elongation factor Ts